MTIYKIQLFAYGEQDYYLTGNPQISFFKKYTEDTPIFQLKKGISVLEKMVERQILIINFMREF